VVTLYTCIWEMLIFNFGQDNSYPDWGFSWFFSVHLGKCWDYTMITSWPLLSKSFPIHDSYIILPFYAIYANYWRHHKVYHQRKFTLIQSQYNSIGILFFCSECEAVAAWWHLNFLKWVCWELNKHVRFEVLVIVNIEIQVTSKGFWQCYITLWLQSDP
jgi:hypothetical protein